MNQGVTHHLAIVLLATGFGATAALGERSARDTGTRKDPVLIETPETIRVLVTGSGSDVPGRWRSSHRLVMRGGRHKLAVGVQDVLTGETAHLSRNALNER